MQLPYENGHYSTNAFFNGKCKHANKTERKQTNKPTKQFIAAIVSFRTELVQEITQVIWPTYCH